MLKVSKTVQQPWYQATTPPHAPSHSLCSGQPMHLKFSIYLNLVTLIGQAIPQIIPQKNVNEINIIMDLKSWELCLFQLRVDNS